VTIARDGREGLALSEAEHFDIIATDQQMPGLDGLEVLRLLAARVPAPVTLMITGAGNEAIAVEAMKLGAADYIIKDVEGRYL
ncbi:response regulator, partial [Citrobacter sp. AAK_AS5]